jgi:hypothetical protein
MELCYVSKENHIACCMKPGRKWKIANRHCIDNKNDNAQYMKRIKNYIYDIYINNNYKCYTNVMTETDILYSKICANNVSTAKNKLYEHMLTLNIKLGALLTELTNTDTKFYLAGSTVLWSLLSDTKRFMPHDYDFYVAQIDTNAIQLFESILKKVIIATELNATMVVSDRPLSVNFIFNVDNYITHIQLLKINFHKIAEIFAHVHIGHLCVAYYPKKEQYRYMPQRIDCSNYVYHNSLSSMRAAHYIIQKYVYRGLIKATDPIYSIYLNSDLTNNILQNMPLTQTRCPIKLYNRLICNGRNISVPLNNAITDANTRASISNFYDSCNDINNMEFLDSKYLLCEILAKYIKFDPVSIFLAYNSDEYANDQLLACCSCSQIFGTSSDVKKYVDTSEIVKNHTFHMIKCSLDSPKFMYTCPSNSDNKIKKCYDCFIKQGQKSTQKSARKI